MNIIPHIYMLFHAAIGGITVYGEASFAGSSLFTSALCIVPEYW